MKEEITLEQIQNFKGKYPRQLWYLFFSEMWERFCFYGMRGMLTVFMAQRLLMDEATANLKYGAIQAFVYAFTFVGGLFADKILGFRKSLFWGGALMIVGSFTVAVSPDDLFWIGTCISVIGTGFFKPNISTMVGALYKDGDGRRNAGFGLFYTGINAGALLGGVLMVQVGKYTSWSLAFALAGIVMIISVVTFLFTQKSLGPIGLSPLAATTSKNKKRGLEFGTYFISLLAIPFIFLLVTNTQYTNLFMYIVGPVTLIYVFIEMRKYDWDQNKKIIAALIFIFFSVFFWAFFEQSGGSLSLFALNHLDGKVLGFLNIDPNVINNSSNSLFIILFSTPIGLLWLWLNRRKAEPNDAVKFGISFFFLALGFYIFYTTVFYATGDGKTSIDIFTLAWLVLTIGELCLSPIGLSLMTKLSPKPMQGLMMGMWFLASAYGQYVAGLLGAEMSLGKDATNAEKLVSYTNGYKDLALYALIAGVVLLALSPLVKKLMGNVR